MLGKFVKIKVTQPVGSRGGADGFRYELNYGELQGRAAAGRSVGAYIMGINHPVREFDGRVIAILRFAREKGMTLIAAPKSKRFIVNDIRDALAFCTEGREYTLECLFERSCGAVVYRIIGGKVRYLLIKNKRSAHWGFPKGHMEKGETQEETAIREVLEETGVHIELLPNFASKSEYTIQGRVEKLVTIFLAKTSDTQTVIQEEEIADYIWLGFSEAMRLLKFENDRTILRRADVFLKKTFAKEGGNHG